MKDLRKIACKASRARSETAVELPLASSLEFDSASCEPPARRRRLAEVGGGRRYAAGWRHADGLFSSGMPTQRWTGRVNATLYVNGIRAGVSWDKKHAFRQTLLGTSFR